MKKAIKLLSLAMLFALPLAACGNNNNGGGSQSGGSGDSGGGSGSGGGGSGSGGGGSGGGGGGSSLTAKGEATRIAAEMYGIEESKVTFADYEDEEAEADVYKYESSKLSFYMTGYYDDEMSYDEMVSDIKSFMPSGAKKNSTYSYGEEDLSEDGITYIYYDEVYTKDGMAYNVMVEYYEDDEYGIDAAASICVLKESQLAAYAEYFDSEGDDDWDDDDWGDDDWDDDDQGGGGEVSHAGTKSDPYTVSDAYSVWWDLEEKEATKGVYVTGTVTDNPVLSGDRLQFHMSDGKCEEDLQVWNINNVGGGKCTSSTLKKGDTVVVTGSLKAFVKGEDVLFQLCYDSSVKAACEIISINGGGGQSGGGDSGDEGGDEGGGGGTVIEGAVVIDFASVSNTSGTVNGIQFSSSKAEGQSEPAYRPTEKELRLYAKNTITISGSQMSQIVFDSTCTNCKSYTKGSIASVSTGKISGNTWTGSASSVTFTISASGQFHVHSIQVA